MARAASPLEIKRPSALLSFSPTDFSLPYDLEAVEEEKKEEELERI